MDRFAQLPVRQLAIGQDQPTLAPVNPAPAEDPDQAHYRAKATEAAVKFESFFISHMLHQMRSSTRELAGDDGMQHDRSADDMLGMADNLVADQMAGRRAFGVADAILRQLLPQAAAPVTPGTPLTLPERSTKFIKPT
ncbi:MAG: flagellar biosynthesis protein FlgJ [Pseudomonadota bacterium]